MDESKYPFRWLLLDLNSYFASVEQQLNPALRGKPIAVVPTEGDNTGVIAASYEAKRFGIKTNTRVGDAKRMCPGLICIEGNHEEYVRYHHRIVDTIETCLPVTSVLSIDEVACSLMGEERSEAGAVKLALKIKDTIAREVGECLTSSIGLAPNRFLAKVASDMQKPNGLTKIRRTDLPHILHPLKLRDLPGIGANMEKRLHLYGIRTMSHFLSIPREDMRQIWGGVNGERFYDWLQGLETEEQETERRTIGHSHVLPPEYRNWDKSYLVAQKLLHKAAVRLRKINYWAGAMSLSVRFLNHDEKHYAYTNMEECRDDLTLLEVLGRLWPAPRERQGKVPLKVSITFYNIVPDHLHNLSFFDNPRRQNLAKALDEINQKYGKRTLRFAALDELDKDAAPVRIAFTNIPDIS
jgi:DNA polymerase IV